MSGGGGEGEKEGGTKVLVGEREIRGGSGCGKRRNR